MSKKEHFCVILFEQSGLIFDYPKGIPLPQIGEFVILSDCAGRVVDVRHNIQNNISETRLIVRSDE